MKAIDVTPRLVGKRLRVEADDMRIEGQLQDLAVLTETLTEHTRATHETTRAVLIGVVLNIAGHELRLHGDEQVAITGGSNGRR